MTSERANSETLSALDRPNSYIGKTVPRPNLDRLMQGRGVYVSDIELPRMVHVVFLRSPHAHANIRGIDASAARQMPGVVAVITGQELAAVITPWVGVLSHLKGLKSAPQSAIAIDRVCWQGEAVAAVVAASRAQAEDAAEHVLVEYEELDAVTNMHTALDPSTPVIHASLGDNLAFERNHDAGIVDQAFAESDEVVEADTRAAGGCGGLECRGSAIDDLSGHSGTLYGAKYCGVASRLEGAAGARGLQGRWRLLRHQGPYLCR
jgi:carbon-monoxide dehydrogenase large subunit